jgi:hypothetical protein
MYYWIFIFYLQTLVSARSLECTDKYISKADFYPLVSTKTDYDRVRGKIQRPKPSK